MEVTTDIGPAWDDFRYRVLEAFEHPAFDGYETLSVNDSIDDVNGYAGMSLLQNENIMCC